MAISTNSAWSPPWALALLIILILGFNGSFQVSSGDASLRAQQAVDAAVEFYSENSNLELSGALETLPGAGAVSAIHDEHMQERSEVGYHRMTRRLREKTQAKFDGLVDEAMAAHFDANPGWRHGLVPGESESRRLWLHVFYSESNLALLVSLLFLALTGYVVEKSLGTVFFSAFCVLSAAVTGWAFLTFHGELGLPWTGPSGIIAGLVGIYAVVAFSGTAIPGWLVLPLWIFAECFLVRNAWGAGTASLPLYAEGSGLLLGIGVGLVLPALQKKAAAEAKDSPQNRVRSALGAATQLRGDGKPLDALALLEEELGRAPSNRDLITASWEIACEVRDPERMAAPMVSLIRDRIRQSQLSEAVELWLSLEAQNLEVQLGTQVLVRLGEALLDDGHPEVAVRTLAKSLASSPPLSAALAVRVVMVARDLDPVVAGRAASIALRDTHLNPDLVDDLQQLTAAASSASPGNEPTLSLPEPIAEAPPPMIADAPVEGEPGASDLFSQDADPGPLGAAPDDSGDMNLDPHAITAERLQESFNEDLPEELLGIESTLPAVTSNDVESLDPNAFSMSDLQAEASLPEPEPVEPTGSLGESTASLEDDELEDTDVDILPGLRSVETVMGVPVSLDEDGLSFEVEGQGKKRIPYDRIQALSVGAVSGLSAKPVIIADLVLNWTDVTSPILKVVRLRSDTFNPLQLMPDSGTALAAISGFFAELLRRSGAIPIPTAEAVRGQPFSTYRDLAHYHREALNAAD